MPGKSLNSKIIVAGAVVLITISATALLQQGRFTNTVAAQEQEPPKNPKTSALGRIVPGEKVIQVTGPYSVQGPSIITELFVQRGSKVKKGDLIAKLQAYDSLEAQLHEAEAEVEVSERLLDQVNAGEKPGTIAAQKATVIRYQAELKNSENIVRRDRELFTQHTISDLDFERSELALQVARLTLQQSTNTLNSLQEIRDVDRRLAEARVKSARQTVARIKSQLDQTLIRAPIAGTILELRTFPGERLDRNPVADLADLDNIYAEAEVYVSDIGHVRLGARANVSSDAFDGETLGTVSYIGKEVDSSSVFDPNPSTFSDKRIIKVRIKLDDATKFSSLVNQQVNVVISP